MTKDLATQSDTIAALALGVPEATEIAEAMRENVGVARRFDFPAIPIPGSGGTTWEVPCLSPEGAVSTDSTKMLQCVLVVQQNARAYYAKAFDGSGEPPACSSDDGETGVGQPGGDCSTCPLAQFGSAADERGQACAQRQNLLLLTKYGALPYRLSLPPTSLKAFRTFALSLASQGVRLSACLLEASLAKTKNAIGIDYAQVQWRMVRRLGPAEQSIADLMRGQLAGIVMPAVTPTTEGDTAA
jgi:hypothetical protein